MDPLARAVLDAVLQERPVFDQQAASPRTDREISFPKDMASEWASLRRDLPSLRLDTFEDYHRRNKESVDAKDLFGEHPNLFFLETEMMNAIFARGGWEEFDKTYPDTYGILHVSQPGFSSDRQQALMMLGRQMHYLMGSGRYYLCDYDGTKWQVIGERRAWRS